MWTNPEESEKRRNAHHQDAANNKRRKSDNKRSNGTESERLCGDVGDDPGKDGDHPVPEGGD